MAKAVRVDIDNKTLKAMFGISGTDIVFYPAQIVHNVFGMPTVEFVLYGNDLPNVFTVQEGDAIKKGQMVSREPYGPITFEPLP